MQFSFITDDKLIITEGLLTYLRGFIKMSAGITSIAQVATYLEEIYKRGGLSEKQYGACTGMCKCQYQFAR